MWRFRYIWFTYFHQKSYDIKVTLLVLKLLSEAYIFSVFL